MTKVQYIARELRSSLWVKPAIMGLAAVFWVILAYHIGPLVPGYILLDIKRDALINLFGILASTMLTVAIFSVTAMVSAYATISTTATPRATRIVMEDQSTQNSLTSFLSAFIYSLIGLVSLSIGKYYDIGGRFILFAGYTFIIIWVLISFLRWVDRVSKLGRTGDTLNRVEKACAETFSSTEAMGTLGARRSETTDHTGVFINPDKIGYIQNIDMECLDKAAGELGVVILILKRHGSFIDPNDHIAVAIGANSLDDDGKKRIRQSFTIGDARRIGNDPRYGMILLAEIADRALSPSVNDPGTAIAVLGIQLRLLETWSNQIEESHEVKFKNLQAHSLDPEDLLDDAFTPISRDGAAMFEVGTHLQKTFGVLTRLKNEKLATAARRHSKLALEQAIQKLPTEAHKEIIQKLSTEVFCEKSSRPSHSQN